VGPRAGLDAEVRGKILCFCRARRASKMEETRNARSLFVWNHFEKLPFERSDGESTTIWLLQSITEIWNVKF
jgi:hypothetical protein